MDKLFTVIDDLSKLVGESPPDSIISRTIHDDAQVKAILFSFAPGEALSEHTSSQAAILYFVQGEADLTLGEEAMTAKAGTWAHMTPRLPHSIAAKTATVMLLLMFKR